MLRGAFRTAFLASAMLFVLTATAAWAAGGSGNSGAKVTVSHGSDGGLVVTLHKDGGTVAFLYELGYTRCHQKHPIPLFEIGNARGGEGVYGSASGCPHPPLCPGEPKPADYDSGVQCPAAGVKSVKIVLENGGTAQLGKSDECSPVPVSIETRGGDDAYIVLASEGCHETISCLGQYGQVQADAGDNVKANCSDSVTKLVQRQSAQ